MDAHPDGNRPELQALTDTDVIVVGAGAAGLAVALWLAARSVRVIVLEGRDRVGGRVRWQSVGSVEVPAELLEVVGAPWKIVL